jgi:hypothetical protein
MKAMLTVTALVLMLIGCWLLTTHAADTRAAKERTDAQTGRDARGAEERPES